MPARHIAEWFALLLLAVLGGCGGGQSDPDRAREAIPLTAVLRDAADDPGFARAIEPRPFRFPAEHGPHPEFRTEWWYFTGNLRADDGDEFGYQLTLFRYALTPGVAPSASAWRSNQIYLGHFAITDLAAERHEAFERFGRTALELAGSRSSPAAVWIDDWRIEQDDQERWHLTARGGEFAIDLTATPRKPPVLQGAAGLSRKSSAPGNASYYYSLPRLDTSGTLATARGRFKVAGTSWLDREWSTSALGAGQTGWDWFALQLDDGEELMLYQIRRADGTIDPASAGSVVNAAGATRALDAAAIDIRVTDDWQSPATGARYPVAWSIAIPSEQTELRVTARLPDQEMNLTLRYWEGAVTVTGTRNGDPIAGSGYVELTGY